MIASIFSKSKPINFLIVFLVSVIALLAALYSHSNVEVTFGFFLKSIPVLIGVYFSVLILDFIVGKNALTQKSNYEVFLFSAFILALPQVLLEYNVVFSNVLVILALRRILSVGTQKEVLKKLFDAGFLIGLASLFYFWAILFFALIFVGAFFFAESGIKKLTTPFIGITAVYIVAISASLLINNEFFYLFNWSSTVNYDLSVYSSLQFIVVITMLIAFGLWSSFFYLRGVQKKMKTVRAYYVIVFTTCIIAAIIVIITPVKNGSEFLFLFAPLAIILTNYIETIEKNWFKESFLITLLVIPIVLLFL